MANKFGEAMDLISAGRLDEARGVFEEILLDEPTNADALYNLGMCFTDLGQPEKAVIALKKSLDYKPGFANTYVALGYAYSRLAKLEDARQQFELALTIEPDNPYALRNLGGLLGKTGDIPGAIHRLEQATKMNPGDPQTIYGLGRAYQEAGDLEKADKHYRKVVKMDAPSELKNLAKEGLTEIAAIHLKSKGLRMDAVMYMLSALELFKKEPPTGVREISFEIAFKGRGGFNINDPSEKHTLRTIPGQFTGLQLVCYMYVGFKNIAPSEYVGIDLSQEYDIAVRLFEGQGEANTSS